MRAVDDAEATFHRIIAAGLERGLDMKRSFAHFDALGFGAVTPDQFSDGLKVWRGASTTTACAACSPVPCRLEVVRWLSLTVVVVVVVVDPVLPGPGH